MSEERLSWWKCALCGYTLQAESPPKTCPGCNEKCAFVDATCYTPECGGPGQIDPKVNPRA
ncbi:MAG: hypothetical protein E3J64_04155 [Anaerolineales bacterium]|nr:MAG: hypothetical protein E3J64_04155 [Anaerolineales bacterium]